MLMEKQEVRFLNILNMNNLCNRVHNEVQFEKNKSVKGV